MARLLLAVVLLGLVACGPKHAGSAQARETVTIVDVGRVFPYGDLIGCVSYPTTEAEDRAAAANVTYYWPENGETGVVLGRAAHCETGEPIVFVDTGPSVVAIASAGVSWEKTAPDVGAPEPIEEPEPAPDSDLDEDGVAHVDDRCPYEPGDNEGCPRSLCDAVEQGLVAAADRFTAISGERLPDKPGQKYIWSAKFASSLQLPKTTCEIIYTAISESMVLWCYPVSGTDEAAARATYTRWAEELSSCRPSGWVIDATGADGTHWYADGDRGGVGYGVGVARDGDVWSVRITFHPDSTP